MGIGGSSFAFADGLFNLIGFVEPLLLVAQFAAFGGDEEILGGAKVELEFVMLFLVVEGLFFLRGFVGAH